MTSVTVTADSTATVNESRVPKTEIRLCTLDEFKVLAEPLFEEHYEEIARNKQVMKLKPNWPMYESVDKNGFLFIYLAMQDDVCIGYSMNIIMHHFLSRTRFMDQYFIWRQDFMASMCLLEQYF